MIDCPTQLTLVTWICHLCFKKNTSEKYERTQQGNLLEYGGRCSLTNEDEDDEDDEDDIKEKDEDEDEE